MRPDCMGTRVPVRPQCNVNITICNGRFTHMLPKPGLLAVLLGLALTSLPGLALVQPHALAAQRGTMIRDSLTILGSGTRKIPFHPGEELKFEIRAGVLGKGEASMTVGQIDTVHGLPTLPLEFGIKGRAMGGLFKLDDKFYSWMDPRELVSRRFRKITDHGRKIKEYEFFPEDLLVQRIDYDTAWALPSPLPLDDLSFVHYARTLPLEVGESYTYNRYFKEEGNPVILAVLRRDRVETEAGAFNTIVVQPIIPGSNLFEQGAEAEVHFSDDDRRLVVYMKLTRYWLVDMTMELTEYTLGVASEAETGVPNSVGSAATARRPAGPNRLPGPNRRPTPARPPGR